MHTASQWWQTFSVGYSVKLTDGQRCTCDSERRADRGRHCRYLERMNVKPKTRRAFTWRTILPNFLSTKAFLKSVDPITIRWVAIWDQLLIHIDGGGVIGEGCPPPQPTRESGERHELPQRAPGRSTGRQRILGIFQGLRSLLETVRVRHSWNYPYPYP